MRIIAGRLKGRRLKTPSWDGLRPTSDKLRETLFNIVAARVPDARVVDAYAGTGAVGIEAISRGAAHVLFIEAHRPAVALVRENLRICGVEQGYTIEGGDAVRVLGRLDPAAVYDLIFLDPPYGEPLAPDLLDAAGRRLANGGLLILERATRHDPGEPASLARVRDVASGDSTLTFYARRDGPEDLSSR